MNRTPGSYTEDYYATHLGAPYRWDNPVWHEFFGRIADEIVRTLRPRTVLDAGCGIGFLVAALRARGIDAWGIDPSAYALSHAGAEVRPYCSAGTVTEAFGRTFDLISCIEVLEHLPHEQSERAVENLVGHTQTILFSSTPDDLEEETHVGVRQMHEWVELFAARGFFRDGAFDAGVVAPHAMLLRQTDLAASAVAREYERLYWPTLAELVSARAVLGSGFAEQHARLARVLGTRRGRIASALLRLLTPR